MRVIAGKFRSRKLYGPSAGNRKLRPTSDRLRETLFNVLGPAVEGSVFVDVFAGTGAVGIEALSRGARCAFFIEQHRTAVALIRRNLEALGAERDAEILAFDAQMAIRALERKSITADFLFIDPPYGVLPEVLELLQRIDSSSLLSPEACVIAEHATRWDLPLQLERLHRVRVVKQGDSALSFYRLAVPK